MCACVCWQLDKIEGVFERPSDEVIRELSRALRQALGVSLFGIDIIINNQTGQHAVIDINAFPGERAVAPGPTFLRLPAGPGLRVGPLSLSLSLSPAGRMGLRCAGRLANKVGASSQRERRVRSGPALNPFFPFLA